ncbi:MAG: four helix bundle protein [Chloroflexi bacterium]|nr:four helix bundle protein [Chloroflexota bacterium]
MQDFRKLKVWEKSHQLTLDCYKATATFPREEIYGMTGQIRRASSSIPANIAEGCGRDGNAELGRFLSIASGSASELEYHFILAHDLNFLSDAEFDHLSAETTDIRKMLNALQTRLRTNN